MRQAFKIDHKMFEKIISEMKGNCCINATEFENTTFMTKQRTAVFDGLPFNFYSKSANERIVLKQIWMAFRKHGTLQL